MPTKKKTVSRRKPEVQEVVYAPQPRPAGQPSMILIVLLIAVSFFAGYLFFKVQNLEKNTGDTAQLQGQAPNAPQAPTNVKAKKPSASDHYRGDKDARYVWIEYSDLECPFCKQAHPDIQKVVSENAGKVVWAYRHFPLSFHPKAQKSAEAVECAADQGGDEAFWKMTDGIYEKMPSLELSGLPELASSIGLDQAAFKTCLDGGKFEKKVKDEQAEGVKAGVQATPTNVIYDTQTDKMLTIEGALPYEQLKQQLADFTK